MDFRPFRALRPRPDLASRIPSLPYDVLTSDEARALAAGDPHSFLHVVKAEIDLDPAIDPHDDRVYARAAENFRGMVDRGWLVPEPSPSFYVYRLASEGHSQTGVLGAAAVTDYTQERIRRHEHTRPAKVADRVRLGTAIAAHPGPVFLTYRGSAEIEERLSRVTAAPPNVRFEAVDGVEHSLWVVSDPGASSGLRESFLRVERGYIADGHHRAAAAVEVNAELARAWNRPRGDGPLGYFLAAYFPARELRILPYDRLVRAAEERSPEAWIGRLRAAGFRVERSERPIRPRERGTLGMYLGHGSWARLMAPASYLERPDPVARLDVTILNECVLGPVFAIEEPRTDPRLDHVGGADSIAILQDEVDRGRSVTAFTLRPTDLADVLEVADGGDVMPPKSTWFHPKLRSGHAVLDLRSAAI